MSMGQKIIKILATVFAVLLAISIIGGIIGTIFVSLSSSSSRNTKSETIIENEAAYEYDYEYDYMDKENRVEEATTNVKTYDFSKTYNTITTLEIEAGIQEVIIQSGNEFHVEMIRVSDKCTVEENNGGLKIKDSTKYSGLFLNQIGDLLDGKGFQSFKSGTIIITIPDEFLLEKADISAGVGSVSITDLRTRELKIEAGTGSITANSLSSDSLRLECGAGSIKIEDADFKNSKIEAGTGSVKIYGKMTGDNRIECGVGSVYLSLEDRKDSYNMNLSKGLGSITIDGSSYSSVNDNVSGAPNSLHIEGGIGSIKVDFSK